MISENKIKLLISNISENNPPLYEDKEKEYIDSLIAINECETEKEAIEILEHIKLIVKTQHISLESAVKTYIALCNLSKEVTLIIEKCKESIESIAETGIEERNRKAKENQREFINRKCGFKKNQDSNKRRVRWYK